MTTTTQRQVHTVTPSYTDVTTSIPGAAGAGGILKNLTSYTLDVIKGGAGAPANTLPGIKLLPFGDEYCESSNIWVRGDTGGAVLFEIIA